MIDDKKIFEDWEIEKLNEYVKYKSEKSLKEKALKEGHAEGHAEGLAKGLAEGLAEGDKKLNLAIKNMLDENLDIELILKITNKSKEEILKIKESIK